MGSSRRLPENWIVDVTFASDSFPALMERNINLVGSREHTSSQLMCLVSNVCVAAMKRGSEGNRDTSECWWNGEIAVTANSRSRNFESHATTAPRSMSGLKIIFKNSKRRTWTELCNMVIEDPWGGLNQTVRAKFRCREAVPPPYSELLDRIVASLFPHQKEHVRVVDMPVNRYL